MLGGSPAVFNAWCQACCAPWWKDWAADRVGWSVVLVVLVVLVLMVGGVGLVVEDVDRRVLWSCP